jgi:hypothetical protein
VDSATASTRGSSKRDASEGKERMRAYTTEDAVRSKKIDGKHRPITCGWRHEILDKERWRQTRTIQVVLGQVAVTGGQLWGHGQAPARVLLLGMAGNAGVASFAAATAGVGFRWLGGRMFWCGRRSVGLRATRQKQKFTASMSWSGNVQL